MSTLPNPSSPSQEMVLRLMEEGYSAVQIAELLEQRVSWRTIYRWARGDSEPQRTGDKEALRALLTRIEESASETPETPETPTP